MLLRLILHVSNYTLQPDYTQSCNIFSVVYFGQYLANVKSMGLSSMLGQDWL